MHFTVVVRNFLALVVKMNRAAVSQVAYAITTTNKLLITTVSKTNELFICTTDRHQCGATLTFQALPYCGPPSINSITVEIRHIEISSVDIFSYVLSHISGQKISSWDIHLLCPF